MELDDDLDATVQFDDLNVTVDFEGSITQVIGGDCPTIYEINGGDADGDEQFQHINGYLNGGDAEQP